MGGANECRGQGQVKGHFNQCPCGLASSVVWPFREALAGRSVLGLQDLPWLSGSLSEFWARRWNRLVQSNLDRGFFRPWGRRRSPVVGTMNAFLASGAMHVIAVFDAGPPTLTLLPSAIVMSFFLINGALVLAERPLGLHPPPGRPPALIWARLRTVAVMALLSPMLLSPFANVAGVHGRWLGMGAGTPPGQAMGRPVPLGRARPRAPGAGPRWLARPAATIATGVSPSP